MAHLKATMFSEVPAAMMTACAAHARDELYGLITAEWGIGNRKDLDVS